MDRETKSYFAMRQSMFLFSSTALAPRWLSIAKIRGDLVRIESLEL
jgi:hypothetical protein